MNIDKILIACHRKDFWQTKICVASIRYWYPDFPISLIKDVSNGDFDTKELQEKFDIGVESLEFNKFGWGVSKFEPLFNKERKRLLILDSDIVFLGRVLDYLNIFDQDFVIDEELIEDANTPYFKKTYFDLDKVNKTIDPVYKFPGFAFNTGQFLCTTGIFKREDFLDYIEWRYGQVPVLKKTDTFACADQGIFNFFLQQKTQQGKISLGRAKFMIWGNSKEISEIDENKIFSKEGYDKLIHWAGGFKSFDKINRIDILLFYQKIYYSRVSFGEVKRQYFNFSHNAIFKIKKLRKNYGIVTFLKRIFH
jgi:hypothetical protein